MRDIFLTPTPTPGDLQVIQVFGASGGGGQNYDPDVRQFLSVCSHGGREGVLVRVEVDC